LFTTRWRLKALQDGDDGDHQLGSSSGRLMLWSRECLS
jgi:hypothetical protein